MDRQVKGILGAKLGMTQVWDNNRVVPVTVVQAGPCVVSQVRSAEKDGYSAVQLAYGTIDPRKVKKPISGHYAKADVAPRRHIVELRTVDAADYSLGQEVTVEEFPAGVVIDVTGKTIIPGFVDVHAHMWPPRGVHQPQVWYYLANLAYGVTTTRDPQTSTNDIFAYADLVEAGEIIGPRVMGTGPGVFAASGLDDEEAVTAFLKRYRESYATDTIKSYVPGDRIVRQWVIKAAAKYRLMPTTEGALDMKLDLSQMTDGFTGLEHSLPIQPIYKDVAQFVAKTRTYYTPTILVAYGAPWSENYYFQHTDGLPVGAVPAPLTVLGQLSGE